MAVSHSKGTILTLGGSQVLCVTSINKQGGNVDKQQSTCLEDTGKYHSYTTGFAEAGSISLGLFFDKTQYAALHALEGVAGTTWSITLPDGGSESGDGTLSGLSIDAQVGSNVAASATIEIEGDTTFSTGA